MLFNVNDALKFIEKVFITSDCMLILKYFVPCVVVCLTGSGVYAPGSGVDAVGFGLQGDFR